MLGIGIDTGGTCTDAVIYDFDKKEILGSGKTRTTKENLEIGIGAALDQLPADLVRQAGMIALSTTLATNACLENRGARAKVLLIGFDETLMDHLKGIYASYGLTDMSRFVILDAKVEGLYSQPFDPDWEDLRKKAAEYFGDCDSIGIVQKHPRANGGRFELTALRILEEELAVPITISFHISNEVDILKTIAGTMLNARLVPLISEFMEAVHHVMEARGLHIPVSIVRSDGTMMSENMAAEYPVETILCGPAASVVGGSELAGEENGIIVDMGGTTTDIAIIRQKVPIPADSGIRIGQWKTMVKGLYVETFGLGGDTAVRYSKNHLYLDTVRIIPISVLADRYDYVLPKLQKLAEEQRFHSCWIHEFYVLLKDISDRPVYSDYEKRVCEMLKDGPVITLELADRVGCDPRFLNLDQLEEDGVIIKSGLTPTDMMILKGDFDLYDGAAARAAIDCLFANIVEPLDEVPDLVYDMVTRRMYHYLGQLILKQQYPGNREFCSRETLEPLLDCFYEQAVRGLDRPETLSDMTAALSLSTDYPLIGVGAPIHVFLPRVAALLHTRAVIPPYAGVANALGAAASRLVAHEELVVKSVYDGIELKGYRLYEEGRYRFFKKLEPALVCGREVLERSVRKRAALQGIKGEPRIVISEEENRFNHRPDGLLFEVRLLATATEGEKN